MKDLIRFLLDNPILLVFVVMAILGNLGGSATAKARRRKVQQEKRKRIEEALGRGQRGNDPFDEPAAQTGTKRIEEAGDEVARRIREILGRAQGAPPATREEPPVPDAQQLRQERRDAEEARARASFEAAAALDSIELTPSEFDQRADGLTDMDDALGAVRRVPPRRILPVVPGVGRTALPTGMSPRQLVIAQMVLGPPRATSGFDDEASRLLR
ncbi:MAG: hypothetical protein H6832_14375 [Planctomycetes bacterium]|nr:hypothetical protein [Planctomycetota bacterium]MCB9919585.1 hypothetical protein [Planctomycetota bacterium]